MSLIDEEIYSPKPNAGANYGNLTVTCKSHHIKTTITRTPSVVRRWVSNICGINSHRIRNGNMVVGLGVQWTPSAEAGVRNRSPAILQLCVGHRCLIFQLGHATGAPLSLRRFLSDPRILFVGVANGNDNAILRRWDDNLSVSNLVNLRKVADRTRGYSRKISMEELADLVLGMRGVKKPTLVGRSNWDAYWLSPAQIRYACLDAFISFSIGKTLEVWDHVEDEDRIK